MSKLQTTLIAIGTVGLYVSLFPQGVSPNNPIPDNPTPIVIPVVPDVPSIPAPTKPSVLAIAQQITQQLSVSKEDALLISSTFKDWAKLISQDPDIKNTQQFREVFLESNKIFFRDSSLVGKYPGLDNLISNLIVASLKGSDPTLVTGKENVVLNTTIRTAYIQAMNAVAWAANEAHKLSK